MKSIELALFADYYQFYLHDEQADGNLSDSWDDEAVKKMLALAPGTIGIGTARNTDVPVSISITNEEPKDLPLVFDRMNEASIDIPSGILVVAGTTDEFAKAKRLSVTPGTYAARIYYINLEDDDAYIIYLWKE